MVISGSERNCSACSHRNWTPMVVVMGPFLLEGLFDSAVLTCCCLNTDNTEVNNSVQKVLILEVSVLRIG